MGLGGRGMWVLRRVGTHTNHARSTWMFFQFSITCKRTNNANNATHYVMICKQRRESSKCKYYIISPRVTIKAIIINLALRIPWPCSGPQIHFVPRHYFSNTTCHTRPSPCPGGLLLPKIWQELFSAHLNTKTRSVEINSIKPLPPECVRACVRACVTYTYNCIQTMLTDKGRHNCTIVSTR